LIKSDRKNIYNVTKYSISNNVSNNQAAQKFSTLIGNDNKEMFLEQTSNQHIYNDF